MNSRKSLYDIKSFYNKKAILKASYQGMRYQVEQFPEDGGSEIILRTTVWPEPLCFEKTQEAKKTVQDFTYSEEGLDQAYEWLCTQYRSREDEWKSVVSNPYQGLF